MRGVWLFGYGSLLWNPGFAYLERRQAYAPGWVRRFWQGSTDHRGTPEVPGRVVTLVPQEDSGCWGLAYRLPAERSEEILEALDFREKGGYGRQSLPVLLEDGRRQVCLTYYAGPDNPEYLGPASLRDLVGQISRAVGPSGPNQEYVLQLAASLRELGREDHHVFELEHHLIRRPR